MSHCVVSLHPSMRCLHTLKYDFDLLFTQVTIVHSYQWQLILQHVASSLFPNLSWFLPFIPPSLPHPFFSPSLLSFHPSSFSFPLSSSLAQSLLLPLLSPFLPQKSLLLNATLLIKWNSNWDGLQVGRHLIKTWDKVAVAQCLLICCHHQLPQGLMLKHSGMDVQGSTSTIAF